MTDEAMRNVIPKFLGKDKGDHVLDDQIQLYGSETPRPDTAHRILVLPTMLARRLALWYASTATAAGSAAAGSVTPASTVPVCSRPAAASAPSLRF